MTKPLTKTKQVGAESKCELLKTAVHLDGTAKHPDWLGGDTDEVQGPAPGGCG